MDDCLNCWAVEECMLIVLLSVLVVLSGTGIAQIVVYQINGVELVVEKCFSKFKSRQVICASAVNVWRV